MVLKTLTPVKVSSCTNCAIEYTTSGLCCLSALVAGTGIRAVEEVVGEQLADDRVVKEQMRILREIEERNMAEAASLKLIMELTSQAGRHQQPDC